MSQLSIAANGATASSSRASASSAPAPSVAAAPVPPRGGSTSPSPFPFGMHNAATYASSINTNFTEYEDLPGHHLLSIRNLIASSPDESYPETASSIAPGRPRTTPGSARSSSRRPIASPALRTPARGIMILPGSVSWPTLRTSKTITPRATTGTAGRTHRRTNRWCRLRPLLLRQAQRRDKHSWHNSKSFKPSLTSSAGRHRSCALHSSGSAPRVVHMSRQRRALPGSASWPTTTSTNLRN
jgi:hypothetical protein